VRLTPRPFHMDTASRIWCGGIVHTIPYPANGGLEYCSGFRWRAGVHRLERRGKTLEQIEVDALPSPPLLELSKQPRALKKQGWVL